MNTVILSGRLTRDPDVRTVADGQTKVARYTLAVDRRFAKRDDPNAQTADFVSCVVFGKAADFVDHYLRQGTKIIVKGRIQTGNYTNKDGVKIYTTDVVVEEHEFAESRSGGGSTADSKPAPTSRAASAAPDDSFMDIPDVIDEDVPFN